MGGPFPGIVQGIALGFDLMTDDDKLHSCDFGSKIQVSLNPRDYLEDVDCLFQLTHSE